MDEYFKGRVVVSLSPQSFAKGDSAGKGRCDSLSKASVTDSLITVVEAQSKALAKLSETIESASNPEKIHSLVSYDTAFTVIVTLAIFILGILIDRSIKWYERRKERNRLVGYFKAYLDNTIDSVCTKLIQSYMNFYQKINIDSGIPNTPPKVLTGNFERLKSIQDQNLFYAIKEKGPFIKILSNLDFVEKLTNEIDEHHGVFLRENNKLRLSMEALTKKYIDTLARYVEHVRINNPQYEHVTEFRDLVNSSILHYHSNIVSTRQLKRFYKEIIRPIQEYVVKSNIFRNDQLALEITELGKELSYGYNSLKRITIEIKLLYRRYHNYIKTSKTTLETERKKIAWHRIT